MDQAGLLEPEVSSLLPSSLEVQAGAWQRDSIRRRACSAVPVAYLRVPWSAVPTQGLNPVALQEAIDKLDNYQNQVRGSLGACWLCGKVQVCRRASQLHPPCPSALQARARLFRILLDAASQPGLDALDASLAQLAELSDLLIAGSPEAGLVPQVPTIRSGLGGRAGPGARA